MGFPWEFFFENKKAGPVLLEKKCEIDPAWYIKGKGFLFRIVPADLRYIDDTPSIYCRGGPWIPCRADYFCCKYIDIRGSTLDVCPPWNINQRFPGLYPNLCYAANYQGGIFVHRIDTGNSFVYFTIWAGAKKGWLSESEINAHLKKYPAVVIPELNLKVYAELDAPQVWFGLGKPGKYTIIHASVLHWGFMWSYVERFGNISIVEMRALDAGLAVLRHYPKVDGALWWIADIDNRRFIELERPLFLRELECLL